MKNLVREQNKIPDVLSILGIPADWEWRDSAYMEELADVDFPFVLAGVPKIFGTGAFFLFIMSNPLRYWMKKIQHFFPDAELVLHSHSAWLSGGYLPLPRNGKTAILATFHGIADDHRLRRDWWRGKANRFLAQRIYCSSAVLTSVTKDTAIRAEELFNIPEKAFEVIPNGITRPAPAIAKVVSATGEFLVGHVGQMHHGKGWHLLLEAVDQLHQEGRNIRLVLAGSGQDDALVQEAVVHKNEYVQFLGSVQNAGACLIPQLDALVLATWSEGMPMTVIEAFAAGVPVLATAVGGLPEMLEEGVNGMVIERDVDSIARKLRYLMDHPEAVAKMQRGALKTFDTKFEIGQVVSKYNTLYNTTLGTILKSERERL
jgi:glycosyltransferase involved in cell wall biosynthesis